MTIHTSDERHYKAASSRTVFVHQKRGVIGAAGADRLDLLHRLSTNAVRDLAPGEEATTILTSDKGRIVELLRVVVLDERLVLVLQGEDAGRVRDWLDKYTIMDDFRTEDVGADYEVIALFGDHARKVVAHGFGVDPPDTGRHVEFPIGGSEGIVLRETRISGAGSFLLVVPRVGVPELVDRLGAEGVEEIDASTWEVLRIEAGIPATGSELGEGYNPLESGLVQYISFTKGCYIGQEVIARLDTYDKVQRHLVGLRIDEMAATDTLLASVVEVRDLGDGRKIGTVTSLAQSPAVGGTIGLAYLRTAEAVPGLSVQVVAVNGEVASDIGRGIVTKLPFDR